MEACPSEIWICSSGARPWWASLAKVLPQVVRRDPDADAVTVAGDGLEDRLRPERPEVPTRPAFETRRSTGPESMPAVRGPAIQRRLGPGRHRDGADAAVLADEIHDRPAALALRDIASKSRPASSPRRSPRAHEQPQQDAVAQAFRRCRVGGGEELLGLGQRQPVAGPDAACGGRLRTLQDGGGGQRCESSSFEAASVASLRTAASARLIEAADSERSARCER